MGESNYGAEWQAIVDSSGGELTQADAEALAAAGVKPACIFKCVLKLVTCGGPTNPACLADFIKCVAGCIGGGNG
jgi:hypothetical protein